MDFDEAFPPLAIFLRAEAPRTAACSLAMAAAILGEVQFFGLV